MQQYGHSKNSLRNILITICYDGKNYHGWQVQDNAVTVQEVFQNAIYNVFKTKPDIKGCSRTDSGVHANMYCINVKVSSKIPCDRIVAALNRFLPHDICVKDCKEVPLDFHARYSCIGKEYVYKIFNERIRDPFLHGYALHYWYFMDIDKMRKAAKFYIGEHDFTSFCTLDKRSATNMIRNVKKFEIDRIGNIVEMRVEADGFLYNMVRIMVGTLLRVCQGKIAADDIEHIIDSKNRKMSGPTAPAHGLYLNKVFYDI